MDPSSDGLKIVVVGGGSTYTPELFDGLPRLAARVPVAELVLHDIAADRLAVVAGAARRIAAARGFTGRIRDTTDLGAALEGADAVLFQFRIGGQAARQLDETIPLRYGCIGQETTGAGGLAKALRTVPVAVELADEVRRRAPDAWLIDFTNPVGIVTRALLDHGHRAIGLCNVAIGFQRLFADWTGVEPEAVLLGHAGLNHLTWIRRVEIQGRDRLPELLADHGTEVAERLELPVSIIDLVGGVPSYYLRYYYAHDEVVAEERGRPSRAEEVRALEAQLLAAYADPALRAKPALLGERGGAFYSEAALDLLASLFDDRGDTQVVDVRNGTTIPSLPAEAVVEVPARIGRGGATPVPVPALSPHMAGLTAHVSAYEALAVRAAEAGDRRLALEALLTHPLVGQRSIAEPLLDDLLRVHRPLLPRFT